MDIRRLTEDDVAAYHALRLQGLHDHPEAFGASFEEEQGLSDERIKGRMRDNATFRAFLDGMLVGIVTLLHQPYRKTRHRAMIVGMYVVPQARGRKLGKALLDAVIVHARTLQGVEDVTLGVTVGNGAARALYVGAGFQPYAIELRYIKLDDQYWDIEWMLLRLVRD